MWDRTILKSNAKAALRGRYWNAFLMCVLAALLNGEFFIFAASKNWDWERLLKDPSGYGASVTQNFESLRFFLFLFGIFVGIPGMIGLARYFVRNHFGAARTETLFSGFRYGYLNGIGAVFVTRLFVILWFFLLVIPGIVKLVQYSMVPFLLSDNPELPGSRARQISRMMTDGQKGSIFVLWLSFLGWYLLAGIAGTALIWISPYFSFLVGDAAGFFVLPYFHATMTELYLFLRDRGIRSGMINPAELGLSAPAAGPSVN